MAIIAGAGFAAIILSAIAATLGSILARVTIGAGLSVVTYVGLNSMISSLMADVASYLGQVPEAMGQLFALAGLGHAFDVIFSTILACVSVALAGRVAGVNFG